mgnify:CR=1 FL=1
MSETNYTVDDAMTGRGVLGPFNREEYAEKCMNRYEDKWPGLLEVNEQ